MYSCPNCGAPITGPKCEYCGTVFESTPIGTTLYSNNIPLLTLLTPNEARELMGLPRIKEVEYVSF